MDRSKLYDLIYDKADRLLKEYNPCNIHINKQGIVRCRLYNSRYKQQYLCCSGCVTTGYRDKQGQEIKKYWSNKGCTIRCLACKLYLCEAKYRHKKLRKELDRLERIAVKYKIFAYFTSKEDIFKKEEICI